MKLGDRNSPPPQKGSQISKICDLGRLSLSIMKRGLSGIQGFRVEVADVVETLLSMEVSELTETEQRVQGMPLPESSCATCPSSIKSLMSFDGVIATITKSTV